jgi:succinyl-diaminopimelate desuccinylase
MPVDDAISLTQKLISFNSVDPPGNEALIAKYTGGLLSENGFRTEYIDYDKNRSHLIARKGSNLENAAVVFSGHMDTVPLGELPWSADPFSGKLIDDKIYGRGSSDMKGGIAAMVLAAIQSAEINPDISLCIILTAGEESGCQGAVQLLSKYTDPCKAKGIIIGEPTANIPAIGHKGGLYLNVIAKGKTAHSSMPHLGDNAIYKAAEGVLKVKEYIFHEKADPVLGIPTLNVGKFRGGINLNSVPDHAEFTMDIRTTTETDHLNLLQDLRNLLGNELTIETIVDLPAVSSDVKSPFVQMVYSVCGISFENKGFVKTMPYLTDGAVLQSAFKDGPVVILGPGQPEMAHQRDEYCYIRNIEEAVKIYKEIILKANKL